MALFQAVTHLAASAATSAAVPVSAPCCASCSKRRRPSTVSRCPEASSRCL